MISAPRLNVFVSAHRDEIIRRCQEKVASRTIPPPIESEMNHLARLQEVMVAAG